MNRLAFLLCLLAFPASAQDLQCLPVKTMAAQLERQYEEQQMFVARGGTDDEPFTIQIWASRSKRTFTLLGVRDDVACILQSGRDLRPAPRSEEDAKPEQKS